MIVILIAVSSIMEMNGWIWIMQNGLSVQQSSVLHFSIKNAQMEDLTISHSGSLPTEILLRTASLRIVLPGFSKSDLYRSLLARVFLLSCVCSNQIREFMDIVVVWVDVSCKPLVLHACRSRRVVSPDPFLLCFKISCVVLGFGCTCVL